MGETISPSSKTNETSEHNKKQKNGIHHVDRKRQAEKLPAQNTETEPQKSLLIAYLLWVFGGFFGFHHIYLHRDAHAFVHWCTFAGYFGIGWVVDAFKLPQMVRDCNEDPVFIQKFIAQIQQNKQPPFSTYRFLGQICVGFLFGQVAMIAIPESPVYDIDFSFMHWIIPLGIALGEYMKFKPIFVSSQFFFIIAATYSTCRQFNLFF